MRKGYYDIAIDELEFLEYNLSSTHYNVLSEIAEQVAEKLLKSVLELEDPNAANLLKSNNLDRIYVRLKGCDVGLPLNRRDLRELKDIYFNARYPGENYVDVQKPECSNYIDTMYKVVKEVNAYRSVRGLPVVYKPPRKLGEHSTSDNPNTIFTNYRERYDLQSDESWQSDFTRLCRKCGSTDMYVIAEYIQNNFL